ncbi:Hypothetical predicted protein [Cloeon dipterum]|uniref:C-type lectin domain-containing protein n=1 Tax=Cloeon dipterum TaxID=197152 RepID=A0A8S1DMF4_9INSE|nr:Hypothetical predicted protein [Cloeon dipterum]
MQPTPLFTIASIGICFFILWNENNSVESRVSKVEFGRKHVVIKLSKGSNKNSQHAKRAMIVKCCGRKKCSKSQSKIRKNGTASLRVAKIVRNELNGPSHRIVAIGKKKYMFPPEKATFEEAKKKCEDQGLEIASVTSRKESKSIDEYLNYIGLGSEPLFSLLPDAGADLNWGAGKPPGGPGECLTQFKGAFYNASCYQPSQFSCEKKPGETTEGYNLLSSIADSVLNFVGGKNIIAPSERASVPEASSMCKDQGMDLMNLESLTQLDSVQSFLGDIGLSSSTLLTSLKKTASDSSSNWLGDLASALLPPPANPADAGDCMGISSLGLLGVSCDMVSNFVCEAPPPKLISDTGDELPFSMDLLSMASSLGIGASFEPAVPVKIDLTQKPPTTLRKPAGIVAKASTKKPSVKITTKEVITDAYVDVYVPEPATTINDLFTDVVTAVTNVLTVAPVTAPAVQAKLPVASSVAWSSTATIGSTTTTTSSTTTTTLPPLSFNVSGFGRYFFSPNISLPDANATAYCNNISMRKVIFESFEKFQLIYNITGANSGRENQTFYTGFKNTTKFFGDNYSSDAVNAIDVGSCLVLSNYTYQVTTCNESRAFICESNKPNISLFGVLNFTVFKNYGFHLFNQYTFYEAQRYCYGRSLNLTVIDQRFELIGELKNFIYTSGMASVPFHISIGKVNGSYPKDLLVGWAPGNPDDSKDCVAYLNYSLVSIECNTVTFPLCENKTTSIYKDPLTVAIISKNYSISISRILPVDGSIYCRSFGQEMVSVEQKIEFQAIIDALKYTVFKNDTIAIDLKKLTDGTFKWGSGANFDFTAVGLNDNSSEMKGNGDCGAISQLSFTLVDCFYPTLIICEEPEKIGEAITLTDPMNPDHEYKFFKLTKTHDEAKAYCQQNGLKLIVLDSEKELETIVLPLLKNKMLANKEFYVSSELIGSNAASWVNSANLGWLTYDAYNVQFYPPGTCLISSKSGTAFYASDCTTPRNFLCEDNFTPEVTTVAARQTDKQDKNDGETTFKDSTYFLNDKKDSTYQEARATCQKFSLDLVSIESKEENEYLNPWINKLGFDDNKIFIGLNKIDRPTISHWINNVSLSFHAFDEGDKRDKSCVILTSSKWKTTNCDDSGAIFLCETNSSLVPTTTFQQTSGTDSAKP